MRGQPDARLDSVGRPTLPLTMRALRALVPAASLLLIGLAVWVGVRNRDAPDLVEVGAVVVDDSDARSATETSSPQQQPADSSSSTSASGTSTSPSQPSVETPASSTDDGATEATSAPLPPTPNVFTVGEALVQSDTTLSTSPGGTGSSISIGTALGLTGELRIVDTTTWMAVTSSGGDGWVDAAAVEISSNGFDTRPCGQIPDELPPTALAYQPGDSDGSADGVVALEYHQSDDCNRFVLFLGDGLADAEASFAEAFPADLSIIDQGGRIRVELENDVAITPELALTTIPLDAGEALAILALRPDGRAAYNIDAGPARLSVSFLARPARVVLDFVTISGHLPGVGGGVVINGQSIADAARAGDGREVVISGYARLRDGLGEIALRRAPATGSPEGSGLAIEARFGGTSRVSPVTRSWFFYETPRFGGEWAEFRFTIAGLEARPHELMLGLGAGDPPQDVTNPGIHQLLDVKVPGE